MPNETNQARAIFLRAIEIDSVDDRARYVNDACGTDSELRQRVERLLESHQQLGSFHDETHAESSSAQATIGVKRGSRIGPYKIMQRLGVGGMGEVYMAEQTEPVERRVAIKIIKAGMDSQQVIARFEAERQALAMMDHPNIAKVFDAGTTEAGRPFFVMELVKGLPITHYCDEHRLDLHQRMQLFRKVCHAVQHAHQKGIIHRDLKPSNVMVAEYDDTPVPKIIDFGVAKATQRRLTEKTMFTEVGTVVGTIEYMSPEQAKLNQLDVDTRSDIYSLGVLLYELLTGETPFDRNRLRSAALDEMLRIIREEEPSRPSLKLGTSETLPSIAANRHVEPQKLGVLLRGELDWIVMKALDKERSRRYDSASSLAADIENFLNDEPVEARPPSTWYRFRKSIRRNRVAFSTAAAVFVTLLLGLAGTTYQTIRAGRAEREAKTQAANAEQALRAQQKEMESRMRAEKNQRAAQQQAEIATSHVAEVSDFLRETLREFVMSASYHFRDDAVEIFEENRVRILGDFEDQPIVRAVLLNELASAMYHAHEHERAEEIVRESIDLLAEAPEVDHQVAADTYAMLSYMTVRSQRWEDVIEATGQVLNQLDQLTAPDARAWKTRRNSLFQRMLASRELDRPKLCEQVCLEMLAHKELGFGPDSTSVFHYLTWAQEQLGQIPDAIATQSKIIEILSERMSPVVMSSRHCDLAGLLLRSGQPEKAAEVLAHAIRDIEASSPQRPQRADVVDDVARLHRELGQVAWHLMDSRPELAKLAVRDANTVAKYLKEWYGNQLLEQHLQANQWVLNAAIDDDPIHANPSLIEATQITETVLREAGEDRRLFERVAALQDPFVTLQRVAELLARQTKPDVDESAKLQSLLAEAEDLSVWHARLTDILDYFPPSPLNRTSFKRIQSTLTAMTEEARQGLPVQRGRLIDCLELMAVLRMNERRADDAERFLVEALELASKELDNETRLRRLVSRFEQMTATSEPQTNEGKAWAESYHSAPWKPANPPTHASLSCLVHMKQLDGAKQQWAIEQGKTPDDMPYAYQLAPYMVSVPTCPSGGEYQLGKVKDDPVCTVHGSIKEIEKQRGGR